MQQNSFASYYYTPILAKKQEKAREPNVIPALDAGILWPKDCRVKPGNDRQRAPKTGRKTKKAAVLEQFPHLRYCQSRSRERVPLDTPP